MGEEGKEAYGLEIIGKAQWWGRFRSVKISKGQVGQKNIPPSRSC